MFDSHCHLQDVRLLGQAAAVLARAQAVGVEGFLLAGVDAAGWRDEAQRFTVR
jgi:Tat protein secretion system quality control protein TatD with DNase activity